MPQLLSDLQPKQIKVFLIKVSFHLILITFGIFVVIVLKIFTRTRKTVIRRVILPGTMSGGIRKEIHDTKLGEIKCISLFA